jgi:hypothetical protein
MKLRLVILSTVLVGASAFAQTTPVVLPRLSITRVDAPNVDSFTFGGTSCNESVTLRWANTLTYSIGTICNAGSVLKLWATPGTTCQDTPGASDLAFNDVPVLTVDQLRQGTFTLKLSDLPDFKNTTSADGGTLDTCGSANPFTKTHVVCGVIDYAVQSGFGCGTATKLRAAPLKLIYDTLPPGKPSITDFTAQDEAVRVAFSVDSDTSAVIVEARGPTDIDFVSRGETASSSTFIRGENLQNGVLYTVHLRARDAAGNLSDPSDPIEVTPIRTVGFWGYYKDQGGTDTAGCSTGLGLSPLLLIALALRRARKQG